MGDDPLMVAPVGEIAQSLIIYLVDDGAVGFGLGDESKEGWMVAEFG